MAAGEQAYDAYLLESRPGDAAMCAWDVAYQHFLRGEAELGAGWMARAKRVLAADPDSVVHLYFRYGDVESSLDADDLTPVLAAARALRAEAAQRGVRELVAGATLQSGRVLIRLGAVADGLALLDEAMLDVTGGKLKPEWAGNLYCNAIAAYHELVDLKRMWTWTERLRRWCDELPAAVLFGGICRVHRAQLLLARGDVTAAADEAARVATEVADVSVVTTAEAQYVVGEARRVSGDRAGAERAYGEAHQLGRDPQPGLALLRLDAGRPDVAANSIAAALTALSRGGLARVRLAAAQVEIALAAGQVEVARKAADEVAEVAGTYASPGLAAMADQARGAVLLAEGQPDEALSALRAACRSWREQDAQYDCALVRRLLARAYAAVGDVDAAERERAAAADVLNITPAHRPGGLSAREVEVLRLVAAGTTNRGIAAELVLSEKTVARHLSNIFAKLDVSSRTAAAAYAFDHGLVAAVRG